MTEVARTIHLHGQLGRLYGKKHTFYVRDVAEVVRAMVYQFKAIEGKRKSFSEYFSKREYAILRGDEVIQEPEQMAIGLGKITDIHFIPRTRGKKSGGIKFIIGAIIITAAIIISGGAAAPAIAGFAGPLGGGAAGLGATAFAGITFGQIAVFGGLIAVSGVAQMLSSTPTVANPTNRERPSARPSFMIDQFVNTVEEGGAVPVGYGVEGFFAGSQVISAGIDIRQLSQTEIVDIDTEFESVHSMFSGEEVIFAGNPPITPTISMRGFNRMKWWGNPGIAGNSVQEPDQPEPAIGTFDPLNFRLWQVFRITEFHLRGGPINSNMFFEILIFGASNQDFWKQITVTNFDDTILYHTFLSADADLFDTAILSRDDIAYSYRWNGLIQSESTARWRYELFETTNPDFTMPAGEVLRVKFEYD